MTPLCVDTSAYAAFKRGDPTITRLLESAPSLLIPAVVLGELHAGFAMGMRRDRNLLELSQFLSRSGCRIVAIDDGVARRYGELVRLLRERGTPLPTNDVWIAAVAFDTGATLLTLDKHFSAVPLLPVAPGPPPVW